MLALSARILVAPSLRPAALGPLSRHVSSPPCFRAFRGPPGSRLASLRLPSGRCFATSPSSRSPEASPSTSVPVSEGKPTQEGSTQAKANLPRRSIWSRFLPSNAQESGKSASSFRKVVALALPEKKPLGIAIGLLLVSSTVSMSVPFTIGKLIDYFSTANPVRSTLVFARSAVQDPCMLITAPLI
uniref:Iron-regulated surface determinant protein B (Fur-regulated protein B) (Staphylococcal iron-regulated protein H) (Staphylococcus aureus surface protein J) n=1 Tax=Ganoderma boninense TaxID=34458 RepID=A0A5K1JU05_9APHY|nr:Iron-regulated surface determinant protein B (Fur-regulated protein B) (Staphylococcal iron-regulated protein H) (Staphylococcus aureus surface protein J) [Ganoderma boninense]